MTWGIAGEVRAFINATALPLNIHRQFAWRRLYELAHRVLFTGCDHIILGFVLLEHEPHCVNIVLRMSPVSFGIQVPQANLIFFPI